MKKIAHLIYFALFLFFLLLPAASDAGEDDVITRSLEGQEMIFARRYDDATRIFEDLKRAHPASPAGYFGMMAVYEIRMLEREDFHLEKEFRAEAKGGLAKAHAVMAMHRPKEWDLFLSGALIGLDGFFKARKGEWWGAYVAGSKSRQIFRHVKELDTAFVDADFGLGMYIFWRSVFAKELWFLRMFPDRRAEGVGIVEGVAKNGNFAKDIAKANLGIMYFEQKRYKDAEGVFGEYISRYPDNVLLRSLLGKVNFAQRRFDDGIAQFREILKIDPTLLKPHYFIGAALILKGDKTKFAEAENELRFFLSKEGGKYWPGHAHYWLGRLAELKGDKDAARREYRAALKLHPKIRDVAQRVRSLGGGV